LITGILLILLAFWVSGSDRVYALAQRTYLILFWVGFLALFRGFSQISPMPDGPCGLHGQWDPRRPAPPLSWSELAATGRSGSR
jgi:hypothetical protein